MQIRELTKKENTQVDEAIADIGGAAGGAVNLVKNVGSAIASPFKDVAQGYRSARQDQKVSALADKAFRIWQNYVAQVEQSIAKQPATVAPKANATKDAVAPGAPANTMANVPVSKTNKVTPGNPNATPPATTTAPAATTTPTTAKPNYGTQTGAGAKVTYKQPTGVPNPLAKTTQATSPNMMQPPAKTPATVASTAPGQTITVGGQKLKPGTPEYEKLAKATLKELQAPVSPALAAFRDRSDGKYEAYLTAFVQKNLLAGMGFKGLVNQQEITNAIKAIADPANADPSKQRPLWNDLARATSLAVPAAGALTGRDPSGAKPTGAPGTAAPGEDPAAQAEPAKPTMTRDQISQWISRNSEDPAALKAALDAINAVKV
jgi:hypothetical protein